MIAHLELQETNTKLFRQRKKEKKKEKKNSYQFCTKTPLCHISQEFWPESNVGVCAWKLVDSTFRGPRKNAKFFGTGNKPKKTKEN